MSRRFVIAACALAILGASSAEGEGLAVTSKAEVLPSTTVAVGQDARLLYTLSSNQKIVVSSFAAPGSESFQVEKVEVSKPKQAGDGAWLGAVAVDFVPLELGTLSFPALDIPYADPGGRTHLQPVPPVQIAVVNALQGPVSQSMLKDIKGPAGAGLPAWVWGLAAALIALAIGLWLWRRRRTRTQEGVSVPAGPPRPAWETALEKLEAARGSYRSSGDVKTFHTDLSVILREYLSGQDGLDAMEKTTTEIYSDMRRKGMDRKRCEEVRGLLSDCDLVKFAKFSPAEKQLEEIFARARALVEASRPAPAPEAPAP